MSISLKPRVMWLLNREAARRFELAMLKRLGFSGIFLPKSFPNDPAFYGASIDHSEDAHLDIPADELALLNAADWYRGPDRAVWDVANRYFDALFFVPHYAELTRNIARHFEGAVLLRAYGLSQGDSYTQHLQAGLRNNAEAVIRSLGKRFFFAQAHEHLHEAESDLLAARRLHLPLGLDDCRPGGQWRGDERKILFVCPDIGSNPASRESYRKFLDAFKGLPYAVSGAQPIRVRDPNVLGYLEREQYEHNLRCMRVMFYHDTERNRLHYPPFEAIRAGMPLVFTGGGMLDLRGGRKLPGRCADAAEARRKIERILRGDQALIAGIRESQKLLLDPMRPEYGEPSWRAAFERVANSLLAARSSASMTRARKHRIAVIVPVNYRGGSLSGAKLLAQAIDAGARKAGQPVEVLLAHLDEKGSYSDEEFADLPASIKRRPYTWLLLNGDEATSTMAYAGMPRDMPAPRYQAPDDGIKQFMDCDLWLIVSDRLEYPLLPLRPYALMIYDYLQRYQPLLEQSLNKQFISAAHGAEKVFVTTDFTRGDALQFAGLPAARVVKLPMLVPRFSPGKPPRGTVKGAPQYFIWATNLGPHKNHANALKALSLYYDKYDGRLNCCVTGVGTTKMFNGTLPHLAPLRTLYADNPVLKKRLRLLGELPESTYQAQLAGACFLWHAGWIDNGTFSVIEAAQVGTPALSNDYPAMREIDRQFGLRLHWMNAHDPDNMASRLKRMETEASASHLDPAIWQLPARHSLERLASAYWEAVRECL
jgi:glycosyltransferase involved in cell wall biosynthesis